MHKNIYIYFLFERSIINLSIENIQKLQNIIPSKEGKSKYENNPS